MTSPLDITQGASHVGGAKQIKSFLIHPDNIKRLKQGEVIYLNKPTF